MGMPIKDEMIDLYNKMSNEDKMFMIELMAKDISVPVYVEHERGEYCYVNSLDEQVPVYLNGTSLQLKLDESIKIDKWK